jgi:hypothetical protein
MIIKLLCLSVIGTVFTASVLFLIYFIYLILELLIGGVLSANIM